MKCKTKSNKKKTTAHVQQTSDRFFITEHFIEQITVNTMNMNTITNTTMNTIAISVLDNQLSNIDAQLTQLKELKRTISNKKKLASKAVNKLESGLEAIEKAFIELGETGEELKAIVLKKINEHFKLFLSEPILENCELSSSLVKFPKKENTSNEYFTFEPTNNSAVSTYFNVAKAKVQSTYIAANNKNNLESVGTNLARIINNISYEIREATRFTDYKYELKIKGLDDNTIGWLTQWDYASPFYPQIVTTLKRIEVTKDMELTRENLPKGGGLIVNRFFPTEVNALEVDGFDKAKVRDAWDEEFEVYAKDWYIAKKTIALDDEPIEELDVPQDNESTEEVNELTDNESTEEVNAFMPVTESIKAVSAETVSNEWEELSEFARYNHSQEKMYIKFRDTKKTESWLNYLCKVTAITKELCSKKKQKKSYYLILEMSFASAKALVAKHSFQVDAPTDKDTFYLNSKTNELFIGVNYKSKAENLITQIKKFYDLSFLLKVKKATMLTHYKYEVTGTIVLNKEIELLRSLNWNINIMNKHNSELLKPYLKKDVELVEIDFNAIASEINISLKELEWDKDKSKQYLINTYSKYSRFQLTDDELIEFSNTLKELVKSYKEIL